MNDENPAAGELNRAVPTRGTGLEIIEGTGTRMVPSVRPPLMTLAQNSGPSPMGFLRALKRRLPLALGLAIVLMSVCGTAAWFLIPPPKYVAQAMLHVKSAKPQVIFKTSESDGESGDAYQRYQRSQLVLLKSRFVFNAALQQPGISQLRIMRDQKEPIDWLLENVQAQFAQGSELLQLSLEGNDPQELAKLVNSVARAYIDEVVNKDLRQRGQRQETLKKFSKQYLDMIKLRRETLRKLAKRTGTDDKQTLALKQQYAIELLTAVRKELRDVQSQKRRLEALIKIGQPGDLQETAAPTVSSDEVERLIEQDPEISALRGRHAELENQYRSETANTGRVAKNSAFNPALRTLRSELDLAKKQLEKKRKALRPAVTRHLQTPESDGSINKTGGLKQQMAVIEVLEANLKDEIDHLSKMDQALTDDTLDLQDMQDDIKQLQEASSKIASEVEKLNVELQAPPRITLVEEAAPPTTRDSKKWFMMFGAITLGSFLATLFGVAFLELQTRKVDSADEVVADLGLTVVGSLPMLPTRSRRNGVLAHHEKDRYWYNLLLESIDATRTMLIHAADSGSYRVVMITSALSGEGKTSLASHLATSLARSGKKTLLIDADLRSPSIHRLFDLTPEPGLSELLRGETALEDAVASTAIQELKVITAGKVDHLTLRILSQGGMGSLFTRLKEQFDFVIVDTSPILPVADGLIIAQQADAVLFSILTDVSRKTKIFAAYQRLTTLGAKVLGAVVTGAHDGVYGTNYYPGQLLQETAEKTTEPEPEPETTS